MSARPAPPRADRPELRHIRVTRDGGVGTITIDRAERFNSLDVATARELRRAGLDLARAADVRCVVLTGTAGVFCSGADLKYVRQRGDAHDFQYLHPEGAPSTTGYGESFKEILEYIHSTISEIKPIAFKRSTPRSLKPVSSIRQSFMARTRRSFWSCARSSATSPAISMASATGPVSFAGASSSLATLAAQAGETRRPITRSPSSVWSR